MPEELVQSKAQMISCPNCGGKGFIGDEVCFNCRGKQIGLWLDNDFLFWDRRVNHLTITQNRVSQITKMFIDGFLVVVGVLGLLSFGWHIWPLIPDFFVAQEINFLLILDAVLAKNGLMLFVWITVLTDLYLFYRFNRDLERQEKIKNKKYQSDAGLVVNSKSQWPEADADYELIEVSSAFSLNALSAVDKAYVLADKFNHQYIEPIHVLGALLSFEKTGVMMARLELDAKALKEKIAKALSSQSFGKSPVQSSSLKKSLLEAYRQAYIKRKNKVTEVDIFVALAVSNQVVADILYDLGAELDEVENVALWIGFQDMLHSNYSRYRSVAQYKPKGDLDRAMTAVATPILNRYSQNLTLMAKYGYFMPLIGREEEMNEIFRVMESGGMRNVILVGEKGVGKTAIIQGIAQRMVTEEVPEILQDKRLMSLNLATLIGGATPDVAQERFLMVLDEVARAGNIVIVIENIRQLIGINIGGQQSLDLLSILSQALSNGNFFCVASALTGEYTQFIENDSAIKGVFQPVDIREVSHNGAIQILETKAGAIEYKNQVYFSYESIKNAVSLSDRYMHERYLPEKAISVLDEAAVLVRRERGKNALVGKEDVAKIVSAVANVSATSVTEDESQKLLHLEQRIHDRLIGQDDAVKMVSSALRRARADMRSINRPIANFMFLGPTGVGKTELAKTIAEVYFGEEDNMIRLDMSEYQGPNSLARLLGGGPGASGFLSDAVRKNPFSLILLDEIEKADANVLNVFLQVMDDGRLTDNSGRLVDFTNTIIIATSNAGTDFIQAQIRAGQPIENIRQELINNQLKGIFRPEFLNRFDGVVVFKPLDMSEVNQIARLMLAKVADDLEKKGIGMEVTDLAVAELAQAGFDPTLGARPLRRVIQEKVQDVLAGLVLEKKLFRRDVVVFGAGGKFNIKKAK